MNTPTMTIKLPALSTEIECTPGATPLDIYKQMAKELGTKPMLALINNHESSLATPIYRNSTVDFLDYRDNSGSRTYSRTLALLLCKAAEELGYPTLKMEHAISMGYYGVIPDSRPLDESLLQALRERVGELIAKDLPITLHRIPMQEAVEYFRQKGREATALLIENEGRCYVTITEIDGYKDLVLGTVLPSTGMLGLFGLERYMDGFLLRIPDASDTSKLYPCIDQPKIFGVFQSHLQLIHLLGVEDVAPLNTKIREGKAARLITIAEAMQEKTINEIAEDIARRHEEDGLRVVMIAGPSSSGKTTTAKRLMTQLVTNLLVPHAISLDDFYVNRVDTPLGENGLPDYESLYALDLDYLSDVVRRLIKGETVQMPRYHFPTGERVMDPTNRFTMGEKDILILEGIHGLNPDLLPGVSDKDVYKIYASALTTLSLDQHNWLSTSDNRMLRRMVRDLKYRGISAEKTILQWQHVRAGEEKWIFPYQEHADRVFNTAMMYEFAALRPQAEQALMRVPETSPAFRTADRLLKMLRLFEPIELTTMPQTSLLREFLGGSLFKY